MCTVSLVTSEWNQRHPQYQWYSTSEVSREEFQALKKELEELKHLLKAAKIYDQATGQTDCEDSEKVALFKKLANLCDVDLSDIFQ